MGAPVRLAIAYYSACSSTLLVINKVALYVFPAPVSLLSVQFWFAVLFLFGLCKSKHVNIEPLRWSTARQFTPVVVSFLGTLVCNAKVLQFSNVETFITFRSSTPLVLCICDYIFLGRELPSLRSVISLLAVLASCTGYALVDHAFDVRAYSWLAAWFVCFTAYEVVVKHLCDTLYLDNWTRVVYTNGMAGLILVVALPFATNERAVIAATTWTVSKLAVIIASCVVGMGVSHSAYLMRSNCSATMSAVVGIMCKVITVIINVLIWDKHASRDEFVCLAFGLMAGMFYEQAPIRSPRSSKRAIEDYAIDGGDPKINSDDKAGF